ncbi:hypothetical protein [Rhizobium sp. RU36D]|uniref:hypothetical protein n=1 Tax=Rhizobium sp. RU36D TaxID=1907415 RepID=UPI0009D907AA|nr:hypothetical protein [Rhizobium sp. RU36D]SMC46260.1 hypothetical protein SAMN05880593_101477 [Rhizobium sp. RU36D]
MKFLDSNHPMFQKLWVRIVTVVAPAVWGVVELANNQIAWAIMFLAAAGYAAYELIYMYEKNKPRPPAAGEASTDKGGDEE